MALHRYDVELVLGQVDNGAKHLAFFLFFPFSLGFVN